ncbi:MAG: hypothetical protein JRG96_15915 [Deltaproteobacteria bacterium]|nr:hypothetical protein [Deltaproteobacteria bacterium]MBW2417903.1 hypothetical protein [Deltaproteobacteria bacterium]
MADSAAFDFACSELERCTSLDRLEARGTIRIALKQAGLEARSVMPDQMRVVIQKLLPDELTTRGIDDPAAVCSSLARGLASVDGGNAAETPDSVFARLGGQS